MCSQDLHRGLGSQPKWYFWYFPVLNRPIVLFPSSRWRPHLAPPKSQRNCQIRFTVVKGSFEVSCFLRVFPSAGGAPPLSAPLCWVTAVQTPQIAKKRGISEESCEISPIKVRNVFDNAPPSCGTLAHTHVCHSGFAVVCVCASSRCVTGKVRKSANSQRKSQQIGFNWWLSTDRAESRVKIRCEGRFSACYVTFLRRRGTWYNVFLGQKVSPELIDISVYIFAEPCASFNFVVSKTKRKFNRKCSCRQSLALPQLPGAP